MTKLVKSSPDLGISIPSTVGQNGHEMLPNHGQTMTIKVPSIAASIAADLQYPLSGIQGGYHKLDTHSVLWKNGHNRPSDS